METIEDEILINGSRKIVLGVRVYPELKFKLTKEAENLNVSLSEHTENILLNKDTILDEKLNISNELTVLKAKYTELCTSTTKNVSASQGEIEKLRSENTELKKQISLFIEYQNIFNDSRLLELFNKIKGKNDTIESPDGNKYSITYNQPKDLLIAMIYSFRTK